MAQRSQWRGRHDPQYLDVEGRDNHNKDIQRIRDHGQGVVVLYPRQTELATLTARLPEHLGQLLEASPEPIAKT